MTHAEVLKLILKVTETLESNKIYIDQLDTKLGEGNLGSKLVENLKKSMEQIHKTDTKEISTVINFAGKSIGKFGGAIGKLYGQSLKEFALQIGSKDELDLSEVVLLLDYIISKLKLRSKDRSVKDHLTFWLEFRQGIQKQSLSNKSTAEAIKETLSQLKWAYPSTRSNSLSLIRVLIVRTVIKNL